MIIWKVGIVFPNSSSILYCGNLRDMGHHGNVSEVDNMTETPASLVSIMMNVGRHENDGLTAAGSLQLPKVHTCVRHVSI